VAGGKIYFDVIGEAPARVVYNDGVQDLLIWEGKATIIRRRCERSAAGTPRLVFGGLVASAQAVVAHLDG
jgi:hypothetical protein